MTQDQEREAFEAWVLKDLLEEPVHTSGTDKQWRAWQARAAIAQQAAPAAVPAGWRLVQISDGDIRVYGPDCESWLIRKDVGEGFYDFVWRFFAAMLAAAPAAPQPEAQPTRKSLTQELQEKCSSWGAYWRASDAHGVDLSIEQAVELLQGALGVEVSIAAPSAQAEQADSQPSVQGSQP